MTKLPEYLDRLEKLADDCIHDPWPVSFGVKASYRAKNNQEYFLTSFSGMPLPTSQFISKCDPQTIKAMIAVVWAITAMKDEMMKEQIWYCGIGCEFAEGVDDALNNLERLINESNT